MLDFRVISIGTLAAHPLWGERQPTRAGHATCTLVRSGDEVILVDPGLPEAALLPRLAERAGLKPQQITAVFLTGFHPDTHRGLSAFEHAPWYISKAEREAVGVPMVSALRHAVEHRNQELQDAIRTEVALLERCREAPDELARGVDVFPLPGVSPGLCGLLLEHPGATTLIAGDAVPTVEHLAKGQVLPWAANVAAAKS
ncbi:MAG: MBL fold metallo-hydrolase, partial [Phycisphaerae bacterium]|nr:MBL fold metallo-hydrolase [Phycisphaerae bacterium]